MSESTIEKFDFEGAWRVNMAALSILAFGWGALTITQRFPLWFLLAGLAVLAFLVMGLAHFLVRRAVFDGRRLTVTTLTGSRSIDIEDVTHARAHRIQRGPGDWGVVQYRGRVLMIPASGADRRLIRRLNEARSRR